jgi:hypothetical protein
MKKRTLAAACLIAAATASYAQSTRSNGTVANVNPVTNPTNISQFEVSGRLITQNGYVGAPNSMPANQQTGNFNTSARWNSMGSLNAGSQVLNGFRSQTNGRGLTMGYSVPTGGSVSNPTIQWIGSDGITNGGLQPGNLEFKFAQAPGTPGFPQSDVLLFSMNPKSLVNPIPFSYAARGSLIGQLESGALGSFTANDIWSSTGRVATASFEVYGTRHQLRGFTLNSGFISSANGTGTTVITDFGNNDSIGNGSIVYKFRTFRNPANPATTKNIWQSSNKFNNIVMGRQDYASTDNFRYYLSLFDGQTTNAGSVASSFIDRAGIIATSNGFDESGNALSTYAALVGDVEQSTNNGFAHIGVLGIADSDPNNGDSKWAGYFVGSTFTSGAVIFPSDKRFKKDIADEENIMDKLMKLKPKHYLFDTKENKKMAFSNRLQHGLISQEVEEVFPELVHQVYTPGNTDNSKGAANYAPYKGINYNGLITMLLKGLQEQQTEINELKKQIANAQTLVINESNKGLISQEIKDNSFMLSQNIPNPFSEKSSISYAVPNDTKQAIMAIFDLNGKMILQFALAAGKGQVTINGNQLPAGMYIYSIIANGQEVVSKRMVLTK